MSYRELADKLDLSVTAVHNRIQALIEMGIIRRFTAAPSSFARGAIHILIYGTSKASPVSGIVAKLHGHGSIYWLAVAGGNVLYVGAFIRDITELDELARFVKQEAQISEPTVGITTSPLPPNIQVSMIQTDLCELDYRIINSLKDNSRKATAAVAEELGVSTKTVSRRLARMKKNYLIQLGLDWFPDASNDIISVFHINLKDGANINSANMVMQRNYPNTLFYWGFSNIPSSYFFMVWTPSSKELNEVRESIERMDSVQSVMPNVIYTGYTFPTWKDQVP
jgi:DNA-binding Lrp family transcriptional regulator